MEVQPIYLWSVFMETLKTYSLSALFAFGVLLFVSFHINNVFLYYAGGVLFLAPILAPIVAKCRPKKRISIDGKAVLISGCDSGFGFMLAQRLDDIGFQVFAGCLFPEGPGAGSLQKSGSKRLHVVSLDVTNEDSIEKAVSYVKQNLGDNLLWGVVNNAGIVEFGELAWIGMESIQKTIDVNTCGTVRLTKAFLLMLKESKGRVVSVASIGGRQTVPRLVPYCMSKRAVIGFCDGLRLEMYKWNIQVVIIEPTFYRTPLTDEEKVTEATRKRWAKVPTNIKHMYSSKHIESFLNAAFGYLKYFLRNPKEVVTVMEEALISLHPEYYYTPGSFIMHFYCWISKRLPKPIGDMLTFYIIRNVLEK